MGEEREEKATGLAFRYLILGAIVTLVYLWVADVNLTALLKQRPGGWDQWLTLPTRLAPDKQQPADPASASGEKLLVGRVVAVADGDTLTVLDEQNQQHKIRLAAVDAPERGQAFGETARHATGQICFERFVTVRIQETDRYARQVGWVLLDGESVNHRLVRDGMAWHYQQYDQSADLAALENEARELKRGLWSGPNPTPPWEWRKQQR